MQQFRSVAKSLFGEDAKIRSSRMPDVERELLKTRVG
jgi:hypothetical protein